jgi:hypothetical protein
LRDAPVISTTPALPKLDAALTADISAVSKIDAVASILEVICRTTGMGFSAVARVTQDRWVACAVHDEIAFGLRPGGELDVKTTICGEIRDSGRAVIIDHVAEDKDYCGHHTPGCTAWELYLDADRSAERGILRHALRHRSATRETEQAGSHRHVQEFRSANRFFTWMTQERAAEREAALVDARDAASLREQFVAILAHDLRNPLTSIDAGIEVLMHRGPDEKTLREGELAVTCSRCSWSGSSGWRSRGTLRPISQKGSSDRSAIQEMDMKPNMAASDPV